MHSQEPLFVPFSPRASQAINEKRSTKWEQGGERGEMEKRRAPMRSASFPNLSFYLDLEKNVPLIYFPKSN